VLTFKFSKVDNKYLSLRDQSVLFFPLKSDRAARSAINTLASRCLKSSATT